MKKVLILMAALSASILLVACGDYSSTKNSNNSTVDSHEVTTTTTTNEQLMADENVTVDTEKNTYEEMPDVPTFESLSQGKLVVNCGKDIYFLVAYNCLKTNTSVRGTASNGTLTEVDSYKTGDITVKEYVVTDRDANTTIRGYFTAGDIVDGLIGEETCE